MAGTEAIVPLPERVLTTISTVGLQYFLFPALQQDREQTFKHYDSTVERLS